MTYVLIDCCTPLSHNTVPKTKNLYREHKPSICLMCCGTLCHLSCIQQWLNSSSVSQTTSSCPHCRSSLAIADIRTDTTNNNSNRLSTPLEDAFIATASSLNTLSVVILGPAYSNTTESAYNNSEQSVIDNFNRNVPILHSPVISPIMRINAIHNHSNYTAESTTNDAQTNFQYSGE